MSVVAGHWPARVRRLLPALATAAGVAHGLPSVSVLGALAGRPGRLGPIRLHGSSAAGAVALTFDDGPSPTTTPRILRQLEQLGLQATFFVSGTEVTRHPELIADIQSAGHRVESHGMEHCHHLLHRPRWVLGDLSAAVETLRSVGVRPRYLRPPYGQPAAATLVAAHRHGLTCVLWSCWGREFVEPHAAAVAARVRQHLFPGAIILLHDSDQHCGQGSVGAVEEAMGAIAEDLHRRKLRTVSVQELLA